LYQTLLLQARTVQIRTFHSWFAALLRSAPLQVLAELGLPARYELLEDTADAVAEAWRGLLDAIDADAGLRADYAALVAALGRARARGAGGRWRGAWVALADGAGHVDEAVAPFDAVYPRLAGVDHPTDWLLLRQAGASCWPPPRALAPLAPTFVAKGAELAAAVPARDWDGVVAALFTQRASLAPSASRARPR
jgi:ATP-dependent helicase/nuclease subunit A